ncbi:MAG: sensor histidine kinase [Phycisphaerales bacterium]
MTTHATNLSNAALAKTDLAGAEAHAPVPIADPALSAGDLAELMSSFNEVTAKLEKTHGQLRGEVVRLNTELAEANEALQRSKRLAALGEMAAGISHEIRNPLGSIRLYTRMLKEDLVEMPEQCSIVEKIGRAVTGLDQIVGDVLAFSREIRVRAVEYEASMLIQEAIDSCAAELDGLRVSVSVESSCETIVCDPALVHQALINVIRNAAQATNEHKAPESDQDDIQIRMQRDQDQRFELLVSDSGGGIEDAVIERIFNPFFTTRAAGTGLGLSIVHRILDAHGGSVRVANKLDDSGWTSGTVVSLVLPARIGQRNTAEDVESLGQVVVRSGRMSQPKETAPSASGHSEPMVQGDVA